MKPEIIFLMFFCTLFMNIIKAQGAGNATQFNSAGGGSYVYADGSTSELQTFSTITLEMWIKPSGGGEWSLLMGKQLNGSDANPWYSYRLCKSNNLSGAEWPDYVNFNVAPTSGGGENGVTSASQVQPDIWTHIAGVYDGSTLKIYINGQLENSTSYSGGVRTNTYTFFIGRAPWTTYNNYNGMMDEIRIWNVARTQTQIQNAMHSSLTGSESGLVAYWPFNDAAGASTAEDVSTYSNTGTLAGAAAIVSTSTVPVGSAAAYVSSTTQTSAGSSGGQISVTITSTPDGSNNLGIYQTGSLSSPAVTTETFPDGINKRADVFWGIRERGTVTSDIVLNYGGMSGISSEATLKVLKRTDASSAWQDVTSTFVQNTSDNTFTKSGETSFSEFAIGSGGDNSLPVELTSFTGNCVKGNVVLNWQTATEVNNYGFSVERRVMSEEWEQIGFVNGNGNSNSPKNYSYADPNPPSGKVLYRLKQIDFDGKYEYSYVVEIDVEAPVSFALHQNHPNPFNPETTISYQLPKAEQVTLKVFDVLGKEVATLVNEQKQAGAYEVKFNGKDLSSGIYFYQLKSTSHFQTKKFILVK